jgi:4-hydroxybenzoate polyprenyltransferase
MANRALALIRSLRPEQWLKNGFVLAPVVFAGRIDDPVAWQRSLLAATAFCAASSATYLINDVFDRESDRQHPTKKLRPIASGEVTAAMAIVAAALLAMAALAVALWLGGWFPAVLAGYLVMTLLYSAFLKEAVFVDVLVVAMGFVLRVVGGAVAIDVPISRWLLLCTYLLALYLALGKRRAELALLGDEAGNHRVVLGHYSLPLVDQAISVVLGATVLAYTLYTVAPDTVAKVGSEGLMATVPVVMYGLFRYLYLLHRHELGGSPTRALFTDRPLLLCVLLWIVIAAVVIGVGR